jgi:DNA-binding NtrC family response regulator
LGAVGSRPVDPRRQREHRERDPAGSSEFFEPGVEPSAGTSSFRKHVEALERKLIQRTIIAAGGNQSEAARRLGLNRGSFLKLLKKYRSVAG